MNKKIRWITETAILLALLGGPASGVTVAIAPPVCHGGGSDLRCFLGAVDGRRNPERAHAPGAA